MRTYKTSSEFYTSSEWRKLRQTLMNERVNSQGEIMCAECGGEVGVRRSGVVDAELLNKVLELQAATILLAFIIKRCAGAAGGAAGGAAEFRAFNKNP